MKPVDKINFTLRRQFVMTMMEVLGRALQSSSETDEQLQKEVAAFDDGFRFAIHVQPAGPNFVVQKTPANTLRYIKTDVLGDIELVVHIKHMAHAFLLLSFQEGTATSFANDRLTVDGDLSDAIRVVRILNRVESIILPKLIADKVVKRYPAISLVEKLPLAGKAYSKTISNLFKPV